MKVREAPWAPPKNAEPSRITAQAVRLYLNDIAGRVARGEPPLAHPPEIGLHWVERDIGDGKTSLVPVYFDGRQDIDAGWAPQLGSQEAYLTCPVFEVLYEGTRGPGKTDALIMSFAMFVGMGYGEEWRGVLFRQTFPQLSDVIAKTRKWFKLIFGKRAKYNKADHTWTWSSGEQLLLRHMKSEDDYWNFHGHAYPWIGWEELCNWPDDRCYRRMMSCSRSTVPGMPRMYRATTNPYGPGHNWVKSRFRLPQSRGRVINDSYRDGELEPPRVAVHGSIFENKILLHAEDDYISKIRAAARNPSERAAWLYGSWDIVAGGMFDDLWRGDVHVVPSVPLDQLPRGWKLDRGFDWGSSRPFAVCWFAESNGEPFVYNGRTYGAVRGDVYLIREWYGWNGARNEGVRMLASDVGAGVVDREADWGISGRVKPGPADASIFDTENGNNIAADMRKAGCRWLAADKGPGSRKQGWEIARKYLGGALPPKGGGPREAPGFFVFDCCLQTLETFPNVPRDDKDLDDVDTEAEDHIPDVVRYRLRKKVRLIQSDNM